MHTIAVEQVVVTHDHGWRKWPDTADDDYGPVLAKRWVGRYPVGDTQFVVTSRYYPAYLAYVRAGHKHLHPRNPFPHINNLCVPHERVLAQQRADLAALGTECRALWWDHAHQCFPDVARSISDWFKLRVLAFADDCPGSSDVKTFPVAAWFDALYHQMWTWDDDSGARVADKYRALGVAHTEFLPMGTTAGLAEQLADDKADIHAKAARIASGTLSPEFVFVGYWPRNGSRRASFLGNLGDRRGEIENLGVRTKLLGCMAPDGELRPRQIPQPGRLVAPLYQRATFGLNVPVSSIFNSRLFDLWRSGVAQLVHDRHGELSGIGATAGEHYLPFDGTVSGMRDAIEASLSDRRSLAALVVRAEKFARDYAATHHPTSATASIYDRFRERLI